MEYIHTLYNDDEMMKISNKSNGRCRISIVDSKSLSLGVFVNSQHSLSLSTWWLRQIIGTLS